MDDGFLLSSIMDDGFLFSSIMDDVFCLAVYCMIGEK